MEDIDAILEYANEVLDQARNLHAEALSLAEPTWRLRVRIKSVLENQRSALDYLAYAVAERFGSAGRFTYYPLVQADTQFDADMENKMPGVASTRPDIRDEIERHQPYREPWLGELNQLTRESKHQRLTPQTKMELPALVHMPLEWGSRIQMPYVAWLFADLGRPVIDTLEEFQRGVTEVVGEVSQVAGL